MRRLICRPFWLLLCCLLLTGCTAHDPLLPMSAPAQESGDAIPLPASEALPQTRQQAILWFRLEGEPLLAPEVRDLDLSPTEPYERTLLQALLRGPSVSQTELTGLFPSGTRCTATYREGRRLFVTLSRQVMNAYPDETFIRTEESRMRRLLAMQGIAATVTENCDVDEVIVLVEQGDELTDSLRLRQRYYQTGDDPNALAEPLTRDESLLLTHGTALDVILRAWSERDWTRLYRCISRQDPVTGQSRPAESDFPALMEALPHLIRYAADGGSVSPDGSQATFTLDVLLLQDGREYALHGLTIRLHRERGIWRMGLTQLTDRLEVTP